MELVSVVEWLFVLHGAAWVELILDVIDFKEAETYGVKAESGFINPPNIDPRIDGSAFIGNAEAIFGEAKSGRLC